MDNKKCPISPENATDSLYLFRSGQNVRTSRKAFFYLTLPVLDVRGENDE
jgi:hypothetical protein